MEKFTKFRTLANLCVCMISLNNAKSDTQAEIYRFPLVYEHSHMPNRISIFTNKKQNVNLKFKNAEVEHFFHCKDYRINMSAHCLNDNIYLNEEYCLPPVIYIEGNLKYSIKDNIYTLNAKNYYFQCPFYLATGEGLTEAGDILKNGKIVYSMQDLIYEKKDYVAYLIKKNSINILKKLQEKFHLPVGIKKSETIDHFIGVYPVLDFGKNKIATLLLAGAKRIDVELVFMDKNNENTFYSKENTEIINKQHLNNLPPQIFLIGSVKENKKFYVQSWKK